MNKDNFNTLKDIDIYSYILFILYQIKDIPEYSAISQLAYILDKQNLLKLCEYFGGTTIKIPTIEEFELIIDALILYQEININKKSLDEALNILGPCDKDIRKIKNTYIKIVDNIDKYSFGRSEDV